MTTRSHAIDGTRSVSVVIAAPRGSRGIAAALAPLAEQQDGGVEVLVVSPDSPPASIADRFPWVRWIHSAGELVPELWAHGIEAATGEIVAITTADHVPAADWVRKIREAHAGTDAVAVGGPIAPPDHGGLLCWATWFLRYSGLALLHTEQELSGLAGDNVSYRRSALTRHADSWQDGFWEPAVHRRLVADGAGLHFDPRIVVTLGGTSGFGRFLAQRFRHGIHFGRWRASSFRPATRLTAAAFSPLIPLILLAKIGMRALRLRRHGWHFALSLPYLVCLVLAWSAGEAWGSWRQAASLSAPSPPLRNLAGCGHVTAACGRVRN